MIYFTKEWYELCQRIHLHVDLTASLFALRKNEFYFHKLYQKQLKEQLKTALEMSKLTAEDVFDTDISELAVPQSDGTFLDAAETMSAEEYAELLEDIRRQEQEAAANFEPYVYDEDAKKADFEERLRQRIRYYETMLPPEILAKVADIRVLALGVCAPAVKRKIARFCAANEAKVDRIRKIYRRYLDAHQEELPPELVESLSFHDADLKSMEWNGSDLTLTIEGGMTDTERVTFSNAAIILEESGVVGGWWLYEELYRVGGRYELRVLLENDGALSYLTIQADNIRAYP